MRRHATERVAFSFDVAAYRVYFCCSVICPFDVLPFFLFFVCTDTYRSIFPPRKCWEAWRNERSTNDLGKTSHVLRAFLSEATVCVSKAAIRGRHVSGGKTASKQDLEGCRPTRTGAWFCWGHEGSCIVPLQTMLYVNLFRSAKKSSRRVLFPRNRLPGGCFRSRWWVVGVSETPSLQCCL